MDKALRYLCLARKAGLLACGEESCGDICSSGKAKLLLVAVDASPNAKKRSQSYLHGRRALLQEIPLTKAELGNALGRSECSMVCFTDLSLAERFAAAMAENDITWRPAAELLSARDAKAQKRKAAPRKHVKPD